MQNYINNKLIFANDFNDKSMQKVLSTILCNKHPISNLPNGTKLSLEELCRHYLTYFDFNTLIPMPDGLDIESDINTGPGQILYQAYQIFPRILAVRITQAMYFEDIFVAGSEKEIRSQYDAIVRQIEQIELNENDPYYAAEIGQKLMDLYLPVISHFGSYRWKPSKCPEIDYFEPFSILTSVADKMNLISRIKKSLNITSLNPLSLLDFLETEDGKYLFALGEKCCSNIQKYGYATSTDWQLAKWGTESNAIGTIVDWEARQISFQTSVNMPLPVAFVLHKTFPDVEFEWKYSDNKCGVNAGIAVSKNGEYMSHRFVDHSEEARNTYKECYDIDKSLAFMETEMNIDMEIEFPF